MEEANEGRRRRSVESSLSESTPSKRPRTSLACQRCKSRKQKCDGREPSCSQCTRVSARCHYVASSVPKPTEQRAYVKTLESKIADLEMRLKRAERSVVESEPQESYRLADLPPESSLSRTIRDLSLNASGHGYLGGTSNITLARVLEPILNSDRADRAPQDISRTEEPELDPLIPRILSARDGENLVDVPAFSEPVVERLFQAYVEYVSLPFPVIHSRKLQKMHERRDKPNGLFDISVLHLVYAIGGISLTLAGRQGEFRSEDHYEAAMTHRAKIIRCMDRRAIIYLALASIYCLRAPRNPGPWTMIGLAVKLCISLGLHRKSSASRFSLGSELDKRLFWVCYCLDRDINLTIGRPPSLCDHDIDCPLPLDIDEDSVDPERFVSAMKQPPGLLADPPTTLSYFIHFVKLKRIASDIQHTVYRVDKPIEFSESVTGRLLDRLNEWKSQIPAERPQTGQTASGAGDHFDTPARNQLQGSYMIQYYSSIRLLLFPLLMDDKALDPRHLKIMVDACSGVCRSFKQVHQRSTSMYYSPLFIMSLFLSGLTLIYCAWRAPETTLSMTTTNALTDCTVMLYVMAERWPTARKYRDAFERLKQLALERDSEANSDDGNGQKTSSSPMIDPSTNAARATTGSHGVGASSAAPEAQRNVTGEGLNTMGNSNTMLPSFPHIIREIVREPASVWEEGTFDLNFDAHTATAGNDIPWQVGSGTYNVEGSTDLDFSFSPTGFYYPSDYDFDPVAFDAWPSEVDMSEYGVVLEGMTGNRSGTMR